MLQKNDHYLLQNDFHNNFLNNLSLCFGNFPNVQTSFILYNKMMKQQKIYNQKNFNFTLENLHILCLT